AFGLLAYQSTWLRVHRGPEFLCGLLNEQPMGFYPPDALVHEAQRRGIEVLPPDVNASRVECTVEATKAERTSAPVEAPGGAAFLHGSVGRDLLLAALGVVTAVPLLLFGAAARRIPLSLLGLLQYLTPTLQLLCGLVVFGEPMPPERLAGFVLVWVALATLALDALRTRRRVEEVAPLAEAA
ncbi:MAG: hypothetical protein FWJ94_15495, partial [Acidimicrobiia bacterium]